MSEYISKKEALNHLGRSSPYLQKAVADGKVTTLSHPTDGRKKLFLASDVYKLKEDWCYTKQQKERERKYCVL